MFLRLRSESYLWIKGALVLLAFTFMCSCPAGAQNQCLQKSSELPTGAELLGFRLGMTRDEAKTLVPQIVFGRTDEFGVSKTTINPYFDPKIDKIKFAGVRSISLDFLDDRLTSLWIGYDDTFKVQTVDEFVKLISQSLHLPPVWSQWKSRGQQLRCGDFQLFVTMVAQAPSVHLLDSAGEDTIAARRQAKEERDSEAEVSAESPVETPPIIGDKHAKVFYPPGCHPGDDINEANKVTFHNIADAEKAGFKLSKSCH